MAAQADWMVARLACLIALVATPMWAQDTIAPLPCVVVPTDAVLRSGTMGEPSYAWRYQYVFDVPDMAVAFADIIARLEKEGHVLGDDVSAMGDGTLMIYPCGADLSASVETQGSLAEPGALIVTVGPAGG